MPLSKGEQIVSVEAILYEKKPGGAVSCLLCNHKCRIQESRYGICGVRQNIKGQLKTHSYGKIIASNADPIEKKPLYHFLPGTSSYSIASVGCNFKCRFCQNWQISQAKEAGGLRGASKIAPEAVVVSALNQGCASIAYTYTEPTIFLEYAYKVAEIAKREGLANIFVTNGYMSKQALDLMAPYLNAANVDLKFARDDTYEKVANGRLRPVLESIRHMKKLGVWVEVTTLIIPGLNDSDDDLKVIANYVAGIGVDIPWHISRFHPDFRMSDVEPTNMDRMHRAKELGEEAGLRYVYLGNVPEASETFCYKCGQALISRSYGYDVTVKLNGSRCSECAAVVDGVW